MALAIAAAAGLGILVGLCVGVLVGRRESARWRAAAGEIETSLREGVVPVVEMRARELGVTFLSIPPPAVDNPLPNPTATVAHLRNLCRGIHEKEQANSVALSDTVQIARAELQLAKSQSK